MILKVSVDGFEFFSSACTHVDINRLADGSKHVSCTLEINGQTVSFYSSADMMKIYHYGLAPSLVSLRTVPSYAQKCRAFQTKV